MSLTLEQREKVWREVIKLCDGFADRNTKATIVQSAIAEFGPVPNSLGDAVREVMR
jgi:hypothetical protein